MPRRGILVIIIVAAVALFGAIGALVMGVTQPVDDAGNQFMTALQNHDMTAAYGMLSTELRDQVSEATFKDIFGDAQVASWSFNSRSVNNDTGDLSGEATIDDKTFKVALSFINRDGKWQLTAYHFDQ